MKTILKATTIGVTLALLYASGFFEIWAMFLNQVDGIFWYGMATMVFGVLLKLELKHF